MTGTDKARHADGASPSGSPRQRGALLKRIAISQVRYWVAIFISTPIGLLLYGIAITPQNDYILGIFLLGACGDAALTVSDCRRERRGAGIRSARRSGRGGDAETREGLDRRIKERRHLAWFFAVLLLIGFVTFSLDALGILKIGNMDISLSSPGFSTWLAAFWRAEVACCGAVMLVDCRRLRRKLAKLDERPEG